MPLLGLNVPEARIYTWLKSSADLDTLIDINDDDKVKVAYSEPQLGNQTNNTIVAIILTLDEEDESFPAARGSMAINVYIPATANTNSSNFNDDASLLCLEVRDTIRERLGPANVTNLSDSIDADDASTTKVRFAQSIPASSTIEYLENSRHYMVSVRFNVVISIDESYLAADGGGKAWV